MECGCIVRSRNWNDPKNTIFSACYIRYDNLVWKSGLARAIVHFVLFPLALD